MNFPGFNPSMFNNMSPDQMKMTSDMINGMSDDQLRSYAKMAGMPQMDPQMMRQSANMMKNMDSGQFNSFKNMAQNFSPNGTQPPPRSSPSPSTSSNTTPTPSSSHQIHKKYGKIEKLKEKGNENFKKGNYDEASAAYFEAIIEIEELRSENRNLKDDELDTLEISCRLNYANVKAKEEDYDVVSLQARAVLKIKENGKAYFRLGQALFHAKKYEEAVKNLDRAAPMLAGDDTVVELREKAKDALDALKNKDSSSNQPAAKSTEEKSDEKMNTRKEEKRVEEPVAQSKVEEKPKETHKAENHESNKEKAKKSKAPREESAANAQKASTEEKKIKEEAKVEEKSKETSHSQKIIEEKPEETQKAESHESNKERSKKSKAPREESAANAQKASTEEKKIKEEAKVEEKQKEASYVQSHETQKEKPKKSRAPREESAASQETSSPSQVNKPKSENKRQEQVKIEEEKVSGSRPAAPQTTSTSTSSHAYPPDLTEEKLKQSQQAFSSMTPEQMRMMTDQFKTMDSSTMKNMLRSQGMDVSDTQLETMKSMMTPEMLQTFSKMDMSNMPRPGAGFQPPASTNIPKRDEPVQARNAQSHEHVHGEHCSHGGHHSNEEHTSHPSHTKEDVKAEPKTANTLVSFVKSYWQLILGALISYLFIRLSSKQ